MFNTDKKYFPIKTETACQNKWTWSTLWLTTGTTASCHRVNHLPLNLDEFDNFHNLPKKIKDRELMLEGKWPSGGCEYCSSIELAGGSSDRMYHLKIPNLTPPELDTNPTATHVTPRIVEVFINNLCNMSCVYCRPQNSSQIQAENNKFGEFNVKGVVLSNGTLTDTMPMQQKYFEKFCQWLEKNSSTLMQLQLLGGETFYQSELDVILDVLEKGKNPNLELTIVSNLMVKPARLRHYIERIKQMCIRGHIGRLALTASIDGWGPEAEYARYGLELETWEKNFAYVVSNKWIALHINQVMTVLTMKSIPQLLERLNYYRQQRPISQEITLVVTGTIRPFLHPGIFGGNFWKEDFKRIFELMPTTTDVDRNSRIYMEGIQTLLMSQKADPEKIEQLYVFLNEMDRRRGTNWKSVYPYLDINSSNL